jgi:H+/Cl- antiporter ClcA
MFAVLGAGAVLAATTQGPISAVVLLMELTGPGPVIHIAAAVGGGHRNTSGADYRTPFNL